MKKNLVFVLCAALLVSLVCIGFNLKRISSLNDELNRMKAEKIELLSEHEECLSYKEQSLRKELISKYLDSIMLLANKAEKGYKPTEKEMSDFYERADFIAENIKSIGASPEEATLVVSFVDAAKKTLDLSAVENNENIKSGGKNAEKK